MDLMDKLHKVKGESMMPEATIPRMMPSFSLTEKDFPAIKNWQVGKKYNISMQVEQVSMSKDEYGKSPMTARFKIHKVGENLMMSEEEKRSRMGHY